MRSLDESRTRWEKTTRQSPSLDEFKSSIRSDGDNNPCRLGLRSVCWKISLLFHSTEVTGWSRALADSRSAYKSLREHFLRYIENPEELASSLDPLDNDRNSPWNTLRQDEEIRAEIFQDIERCMPEEPYFRQPHTQRMMLDILFVFCKINQDVGYRQGMHELLAPILWVVDQDAIDDAQTSKKSPESDEDSLLKQTLDSAYIEHDAFTLLSLVMRTAKSFYELGEPDVKASNPLTLTGSATPQQGISPIVERSERIHDIYLARVDPELAKHLTDIEVLPQIFLIRWIRLLFGREFPFEDVLEMWDTLLAEDPQLDLVDMVCVAMLLRIRWQLIEANYSFALMLLLKYPALSSPHGPKTFVDDAIYLRDNFSAEGGAYIINKYSGKAPAVRSPSLAASDGLDSRQRLLAARARLQSPTRFLKQQGGVEAILQGAAKGVFDRGERLGINQAVRDAVGEVKKNMQGLQASRANSKTRRTSDVTRWSLDEGRAVQSATRVESALKSRNKRLAGMLDEAMAELRDVSVSKDGAKDDYIKAIDLAVAKVGFVKVYLEDSTMPLPPNSKEGPPGEPSPITGLGLTSPAQASTPIESPRIPPATGSGSGSRPSTARGPTKPGTPTAAADIPRGGSPTVRSPAEAAPQPAAKMADLDPLGGRPTKSPAAPLPTRASIAQSNFSWMLEPDSTSAGSPKSATPKSSTSSPFLRTGRRPTSGAGREKAAFLFGDDAGDEGAAGAAAGAAGVAGPAAAGVKSDADEGFSLEPIKGSGGRE